jgi:hypothetical protein
MHNSDRRDLLGLYDMLIEFGIPMKLVRFFRMCFNETYNKGRLGKHLSDAFPIQNCLKQGDGLSTLLFKKKEGL